jgi:hypothetical protein
LETLIQFKVPRELCSSACVTPSKCKQAEDNFRLFTESL